MEGVRYTLIADGSSDEALMPILTWLLRENGVTLAIQEQFADFGEAHLPQKFDLAAKIREGVRLYPCELLFVHRDAENQTRERRIEEIAEAVEQANLDHVIPIICVVPIRMQEAWLLFDEMAIRCAANNSNSHHPLELPPIQRLENLPNPKEKLHESLKVASGLKGRRLDNFHTRYNAKRVPQFIEDFSPLRELSAFAALEKDLQALIKRQGWNL